MGRLKSESVVETVGIGSRAIRRKLDERATACAALGNRPFEKPLPELLAASAGCNAHALDLSADSASTREPGYEGELQGTDDDTAINHHREQLVGIGVYRLESGDILIRGRIAGQLTPLTEQVVSQERNDGAKVVAPGSSDFDHEDLVATAPRHGNACLLQQ
jgi:hypothetical protein